MKRLSSSAKDYLKTVVTHHNYLKDQLMSNNELNTNWFGLFGINPNQPNKNWTIDERDYLNLIFVYTSPFDLSIFSDSPSDPTLDGKVNIWNELDDAGKHFYFKQRKYLIKLKELVEKGYVHIEKQPSNLYRDNLSKISTNWKNGKLDTMFSELSDMLVKFPNLKNINVFYLTEDGYHYFDKRKKLKRNVDILSLVVSFIVLICTILVPVLLKYCN